MTRDRNDPTRAGFTPPAAGRVTLSGNETEALCLRAARGAGLDWGLAEEAGFAARWLVARGLDGPAALLAHLEHLERRGGPASPHPVLTDGRLCAPDGGHLDPIAVGAALSDLAALGRRCLTAGPVHRPLLVVPFVHQISRAAGSAVALNWHGGCVSVLPAGDLAGDIGALASTEVAAIGIAPPVAPPGIAAEVRAAAPVTQEVLAGLNALAMRTTVPASAASRADAGSAAGDND